MESSPSLSSFDSLRSQALSSGFESKVEVNQRMLIDKMLARYSSDFVICRELIQNSDDARATQFVMEITCKPNNIKIGNPCSDVEYNDCTISEIVTKNNGLVFTETDWKRIAAIAEGNDRVDSVGQFGVGFFSVFGWSEEPIVTSGSDYLAFVWKNNSLITFRHKLPNAQQTNLTSVIMKMKNEYTLQTSAPPNDDDSFLFSPDDQSKSTPKKKKPLKVTNDNFKIKNGEIIPVINLCALKAYFTKVLCFTKQVNELIIKINNNIVFKVNKTQTIVPPSKLTLSFKMNSIHNMFKLNSFVETQQTFSIANSKSSSKFDSITMRHINVDGQVTIDEQFHEQTKRIMKKSLPPTIQIQLLYPSNDITMRKKIASQNHAQDYNMKILNSLIPLKFISQTIIPSGLVFIGLSTHQTTGIGAHIFTHLIPTIERENLDLQDPFISRWNKELLTTVGQIARFIYDQSMLKQQPKMTTNDSGNTISSIVLSTSFQQSVPNHEIGDLLSEGFFHSNKDLLVPIQASSNNMISLLSSKQAYLSNSPFFHSFLPLPIVPYELSLNAIGFFNALKARDLILEIDQNLIETTLKTTILTTKQVVDLLHWLCSKSHGYDKIYVKNLLGLIVFKDNNQSSQITLINIKHYDSYNLSSLLPLPANTLPSTIASHLSTEELTKQLNLTPLSFKELLNFYLNKNQQYLLLSEVTTPFILSFFSTHTGRLTKPDWTKIKNTLGKLPCIPTTQLMKLPNESYIPSAVISSSMATVTLNISGNNNIENEEDIELEDDNDKNNNNSVSVYFLKTIGCRTMNVQSFVKTSASSTNSSISLQILVQQLMAERDSLSDEDYRQLKLSECLRGTTIKQKNDYNRLFKPTDLHFPAVALEIKWNDLLIIDWIDINKKSPEYAFLKEIGVKEVPNLDDIITKIATDQQDKQKQPISNALRFFIENFQQHYSKIYKTAKISIPFLPSVWPNIKTDDQMGEADDDNEIVLSLPEEVFTGTKPNPLCPILLPEITQLIDANMNLSLLGIKSTPTITTAFNLLITKRNDLLTLKSASKIFSYLNGLEGLNRATTEKLSKIAFIPIKGNDTLMKPSQVFIKPENSSRSYNQEIIILDTDDEEEVELEDKGRKRARRGGKREKKIVKKPKPKYYPIDENNSANNNSMIDKSGLIDYVDFGVEGNQFLLSVGVERSPSPAVLAELLIDRQEQYFSHNEQTTEMKINTYIECLKELSMADIKLFNAVLIKRLRNEKWCLGFKIVKDKSARNVVNSNSKTYEIVQPCDVYLDDDHQIVQQLHPLVPPDFKELTELYRRFGSPWLSESVQRKSATSDRCNMLKNLIHERLELLLCNRRVSFITFTLFILLMELLLLFFFSKGEKLQNVDAKAVDLLKRKLFVLETEGIESKLIFQKKTYIFESNENSTCALISEKNKLSLHVQMHAELDYVDVATELARFLLKNPDESVINSMSVNLSTPLDILKRRGVPIDRLLQKSQNNVQFVQPPPTYNHQHNGPVQFHNESHVELSGKVRDFSAQTIKEERSIENIFKDVRPYNSKYFKQQEHLQQDIDHSCEAVNAANMTRHSQLFNQLPLFLEGNLQLNDKLISHAKQFSLIMAGLAQVFKVQKSCFHLYYDIDGGRMAFNTNGSMFFNLRYYSQVHTNLLKSQTTTSNSSNLNDVINFWYIVTCHELAHNAETNHNARHENRLETLAVKYMTAKDSFIQGFVFDKYVE
ncbi:unnamed protein product [Didymodactylos carnosus]|uniref:Sacsin/Nov domain-containing protein n=1 Tax=Didymodactylos carnosus TaxID=1234261 RepID=A0A814IJ97_9BILA|nr:unnamed protein product [Didymodactylos carnosus]CAF1022342.1 unnamed protein product [Didymodactylos carnosus]CAF3511296.1 unnamed protein product [Didymodactylos carnosus]CAF3793679.1 unnamed protein product [Didymodactylos carnosus]